MVHPGGVGVCGHLPGRTIVLMLLFPKIENRHKIKIKVKKEKSNLPVLPMAHPGGIPSTGHPRGMPLGISSLQVRRSKKAKRILLKVSVDGQVELIVPRWASLRAAHTFFASKQGWLQRILQSKKLSLPTRVLQSGDAVQFFGTTLTCKFVIRSGRTRVKNP